jgi:hypothetical protein
MDVGFHLIKFSCIKFFFYLSVSLYVYLSPASICPSQSLLKGCFLLAAFNLKGGEKPGSALTPLPSPPLHHIPPVKHLQSVPRNPARNQKYIIKGTV